MDVYAGSGRGARSVGGCARSARCNLFFFDAWIQASEEIKLIDDKGLWVLLLGVRVLLLGVCMSYC